MQKAGGVEPDHATGGQLGEPASTSARVSPGRDWERSEKKKREESTLHQSEASLSRSTTRKVPEPAQRVASPAEAFTLPHVNVCTGTGCIINAGTTETAYEFALAAGTLVAGYSVVYGISLDYFVGFFPCRDLGEYWEKRKGEGNLASKTHARRQKNHHGRPLMRCRRWV